MCTVSFVPRSGGFYLAMNRDEKRTRSAALPPTVVHLGKRRAIFPREPSGGTWIAANDAGVCIALINWHRIEREPVRAILSRGNVAMALAGKSSTAEIAIAIAALPLKTLRPFRLIAIVPSEKLLTEWRWNLNRLSASQHAWQPRHWFSSGFNEAEAERIRAAVCTEFAAAGVAPGHNALRKLHRSHAPRRGPFSICMHRADAVTVSYTEVVVSAGRVIMRYKKGPPCSSRSIIARSCSRDR